MAQTVSTLPNEIHITCRIDGAKWPGAFAMFTVLMPKKNCYHMPFGPGDSNGTIIVTKDEIEREARRIREFFPMDYADLALFSDEIHIAPMDTPQIEAALRAFDIYHSVVPFPPGYRDALAKSWQHLYQRQTGRLDVDAIVIPPSSSVLVTTESIVKAGSIQSPALALAP